MSYFRFNNISSAEFGIRIQSKNVYSSPKYDSSLISIPGRDGDLVNPSGRFPNQTITYTCYVVAKSIQELADKLTAIKNWLYECKDSYAWLEDSYDAKFKRKAVFNNKLDITDQARKIGVFTLSFSAEPFRYYLEGLNKVTVDTTPYIEISTYNISDDEFNSLGTISENKSVGGIDFYASSDKTILIKNDPTTYDGVRYTHAISFGGAGGYQSRCIRFLARKDSTISFLANATQSRELIILRDDGSQITSLSVPTSTGVLEYDYTEGDGYIYVCSSRYTFSLFKIEVRTTISPDASLTLDNPFSLDSRPYIKAYGSGDARIIINSKAWDIKEIDDYIEIDSEQMNCYKGTELKNDYVFGDSFPSLRKGINRITFSGGIHKIEVIPRWRSL